MYCPHCGKKLVDDSQKFCNSCGGALAQESQVWTATSQNIFLPKRLQNIQDLNLWFSLCSLLIFFLGILYLYGWFTGIFSSMTSQFSLFFRFVILPAALLVAAALFRVKKPALTLVFGLLAGILQLIFILVLNYEYFRSSGKAFESLNSMFNPFYPGHMSYFQDRLMSFANLTVVFIAPGLMALSGSSKLRRAK